ncbi:hypothetical protein [Streptomyces sp. NPDC051079]|uniref:hypothetical protein n=1 Tax=Streptomyces sp. NPDC051079 TaxID=3155043 RepID=UPI0034507B47
MAPQEPALPEEPPVLPEPGSPVGQPTESEPTAAKTGRPTFEELVDLVPGFWENALALVQLHVRVKENDYGALSVQGPPPELAWTTFDELLSTQIAKLNERTAQSGPERSTA